jgi:hypothetical protein
MDQGFFGNSVETRLLGTAKTHAVQATNPKGVQHAETMPKNEN